jgi:hypothetical protein
MNYYLVLSLLAASASAQLVLQTTCANQHGPFFKVVPASTGFKLVDGVGSGLKVIQSIIGKGFHIHDDLALTYWTDFPRWWMQGSAVRSLPSGP